MRALVTGGAGFIGSHLVDALLEAGHEVMILDDLSARHGNTDNYPAYLYNAEILYPHSILDACIHNFVASWRPEVVYHLAAQSNYRKGLHDPQFDASVNILGTLSVLEACASAGVRKIVFASTGGGVYGDPERVPIHETFPCRPLSPYGASKLAAESYIRLYGYVHDLDYTILRLPNVYGPRQRPENEAGVVAIFAARILAGQTVHVNGDGEQVRDYVHVSDVVRAFMLAATRGSGQTLNIGSGIGTSVNAILDAVQNALGMRAQIEHGPAVCGEPRKIVLDAELAEHVLAWLPVVELADGIASTVAWYREQAGVTA